MIRLADHKILASYIMRALALRVGLFLIFLKSLFCQFCFQVLRALADILLFVQMKIALV